MGVVGSSYLLLLLAIILFENKYTSHKTAHKTHTSKTTNYGQVDGPNFCPFSTTLATAPPRWSRVLKAWTLPYHCGGV